VLRFWVIGFLVARRRFHPRKVDGERKAANTELSTLAHPGGSRIWLPEIVAHGCFAFHFGSSKWKRIWKPAALIETVLPPRQARRRASFLGDRLSGGQTGLPSTQGGWRVEDVNTSLSALARPGGSRIWLPEIDRHVASLSTSARPSGSEFGNQRC
jgi:hypothetical protein